MYCGTCEPTGEVGISTKTTAAPSALLRGAEEIVG